MRLSIQEVSVTQVTLNRDGYLRMVKVEIAVEYVRDMTDGQLIDQISEAILNLSHDRNSA